MNFASPWFLLAGLLVVPVLLAARRSRSPLARTQVRAIAWLQALAVAAAALALAGPWRSGQGVVHRLAVWGGPDDAASLQALAAWRAGAPASDPFVIVRAGARPVVGLPGGMELPAAPGTPDLAAALRAAAAMVPDGAAATIALCTDGRHDGDDLAGVTNELAARGIPVHVRQLPVPAATSTPAVLAVHHPARVAPGEAFRLRVDLRAPAPIAKARLEVQHGDSLLGSLELGIAAGESAAVLPVVLTRPGLAVLDVRLRLDGAVATERGHERTAVLVDAALPVLHLTADASRRDALRASLLPHGITTLAVDPAAPLDAAALACRAVFVDDLPAAAWAVNHAAVRDAVLQRGLGLLLAGTHQNLGPGGYAGSLLQDVLPVRMPQREERRDPSVAVVLIIDTSGSMGGGRIELAKEVARLAVQKLQPHDKVGIVEFYGSKRWAAPLQPATNTIEITRALNRLQAGGGTIIYDAIEEAYYALLNAHTRFQHVLVLTDGGVESGPFEALARRMAQAGQTVSTVLIGPQANSPFLLSLSQWGRGRFYSCPDKFQLPELQFREPQSALLPAVQERTLAVERVAEAEAVAAFAGDQIGTTGALVEASVRSGAEVLLRAGGDPYLVGWDQGNGRVLVLAGQALGPQSAGLPDDRAYGAFLADLLRSAAGGGAAADLRLDLDVQERGVRVRVPTPAGAATTSALQVGFTGAPGWPLVSVGDAGTAFVPWPATTPATLELRQDGRLLASGGACPPTDRALRTRDQRAGLETLGRVTGGGIAARALPVTAPLASRPQVEPLARPFALAALVLFGLGLLLRRLPLDRLRPARLAGPGLWLLLPWLLLAAPAAAQAPAIPPADETAIRAAIRAELQASGDLAALQAQWRQASPLHRLWLARAQGELATAAELAQDPALARDPACQELRVRLLDLLGRPQDAAAALPAQPVGATPAERGEWHLRAATLRHAAGDAAGAERELRAAVAAADQPAFRSRAAVLAGELGLLELALQWEQPGATPGRDAFQSALRRGLWQERAGRPADAAAEYERAFALATLQRDMSFALARLVQVRRDAGTLPALADSWLERARTPGRESQPAELRALLEVLRELGRADAGLQLLETLPPAARQGLEATALDLAVESNVPDAAIALVQKRLQAQPGDVLLRGSLCLLLADQQREAEASQVLIAGIAAARPKDLRSLAQTASELALTEALQAVVAAVAKGPEEGAAVDAVLLEVAHLRRQGQNPKAIAKLLQAQKLATRPADQLRLAEQLESLGRNKEAGALYRQIWEATHAEDIGMRLAWLLADSKQDADRKQAQAIFHQVWTGAGSAARRVQAEEHVLDLAAREGNLADLALELEAQLAAPDTPNRPAVRDALVKIHSRARDTFGAVGILRAWAKAEPQHALEALQQEARVYLAAEEFRNHERTLQKLLQLDPQGELDYRQQLAMAALERGRPEDARRHIRGLLARPGEPDTVALEFAAGIYTLAAQHEEAVRLYRRALALHPERVETFLLLGNALRAAGQREAAIGTFQDLLLQPLADDLFVVAVDGLLNMEAPAPVLAAAVRAVRLRLAARPDQVFLHRVLQDLLEGQQDENVRLQALQDTVIAAGEQRTSFVRELMQDAESRRDWAGYARQGRTLLLLGDEVPPAVFLSLGEALLQSGELDAAARAFARARLGPDFAGVENRTAELYENADRLAEAERIRRRLLRRAPDQPAAILAVARLCEQQGARERALPLYLRAAEVLLGDEIATARPAPGGRRGPLLVQPRPRAGGTGGPGFGEPFAGVLRCAATAEAAAPLRALLLACLEQTTPEGQLKALQYLRHLALATGDAALQAQVRSHEDALAAAGDAKLAGELLARRVQAGELAGAAPLLAKAATDYEALRVPLLLGDRDGLLAAAAKAAPGVLPELGRALLFAGRRDEVVALLPLLEARSGTEAEAAAEARNELRELLGLPVDTAGQARAALQRALARQGALPQRVGSVLAALRAVPDLQPVERQEHVQALAAAVIAAKDITAAERLLGDELAALTEEQRTALVELTFTKIDQPYLISSRSRHLAALPPARAVEVLRNALRKFGDDERRLQILRIVAEGRLDEAVLLAVLPDVRLDHLVATDRVVLATTMERTQASAAVQQAVAARFVAALPDDPMTLLLQARVAPTPEARRQAAVAALRQLATQRNEERVDPVLAGLLRLCPAADARELLAALPAKAPLRLRVELQKRAGDKLGAAATLLAAYQQRPDDTSLLYQAAGFFEAEGMTERAAEVYRIAQRRSATFYPYQAQQLARLELELGNAKAALQALRSSKDRMQTNFHLYLRVLAAIDDAPLRQQVLEGLMQQRAVQGGGASPSFRLFDRSGRDDKLAVVLAPPRLPALAPRSLAEADAAPSDFDLLAFLPEGEACARAVLRTLDHAGRAAEPGLYRGLLGAAARHGRAEAIVAEALGVLATAPHDAEALRVVRAAAEIGMPVPAAALQTVVLHATSAARPDATTLATLVVVAEAAGDAALADQLLRSLLTGSSRSLDFQLRPWLPGLYQRACTRLPAELLATARERGAGRGATPDGELMAALALWHPEPAAAAAAVRAVMTKKVDDDDVASRDVEALLPWCGLCLATGDLDQAVAALQRRPSYQPNVRSLAPMLLAAAVPPLSRWTQPAQAEALGRVLVAGAGADDDEDRRGLFARLTAVLVARLRAAGQAEAATALQQRLLAAVDGLPFAVADWLPER